MELIKNIDIFRTSFKLNIANSDSLDGLSFFEVKDPLAGHVAI